jgi:leader peptidase (prepilin peptidase)/N-methyltransferase
MPQEAVIVAAAIFGLVMGSFITALSWRLPRGEDWIKNPSHCPACTHRLGVADLFPVLSWLLSNGRCRHCKVEVSVRYPATELTSAALAALPVWLFGLTPLAGWLVALGLLLLLLSIIDLEHGILPNELNLSLGIMGLAYAFQQHHPWQDIAINAVLGLLLGLGLKYGYMALRKRDGLGLGDVKFLAAAGPWLMLEAWAPFLFLSGLFGVILGLIWQKHHGQGTFPFGPALCAALYMVVLAQVGI